MSVRHEQVVNLLPRIDSAEYVKRADIVGEFALGQRMFDTACEVWTSAGNPGRAVEALISEGKVSKVVAYASRVDDVNVIRKMKEILEQSTSIDPQMRSIIHCLISHS